MERGAGGLSDAQLVAILLRSGRRRQTALDLACVLLTEFGGLQGVADASVVQLCRVGGVGPAKAAQLKAA